MDSKIMVALLDDEIKRLQSEFNELREKYLERKSERIATYAKLVQSIKIREMLTSENYSDRQEDEKD